MKDRINIENPENQHLELFCVDSKTHRHKRPSTFKRINKNTTLKHMLIFIVPNGRKCFSAFLSGTTTLNFKNDHNSLHLKLKQKHKGKASCMPGPNYLSIIPGFGFLEKLNLRYYKQLIPLQ
jgi:hypothetical protein